MTNTTEQALDRIEARMADAERFSQRWYTPTVALSAFALGFSLSTLIWSLFR